MKNKGVIYQLSAYKNAIESNGSRLLNDTTTKNGNPNVSDADKIKITRNYQKLKAELDGAVLQLKYEMNRRNNLVKKFDKINEAFLNNKPENALYTNKKISVFANEINQYIKNAKIFLWNPIDLDKQKKVGFVRLPAPETFIDFESF